MNKGKKGTYVEDLIDVVLCWGGTRSLFLLLLSYSLKLGYVFVTKNKNNNTLALTFAGIPTTASVPVPPVRGWMSEPYPILAGEEEVGWWVRSWDFFLTSPPVRGTGGVAPNLRREEEVRVGGGFRTSSWPALLSGEKGGGTWTQSSVGGGGGMGGQLGLLPDHPSCPG